MIKNSFFGNQLLEFCKTNSLNITNGRVHGDADTVLLSSAKTTFGKFYCVITLQLEKTKQNNGLYNADCFITRRNCRKIIRKY